MTFLLNMYIMGLLIYKFTSEKILYNTCIYLLYFGSKGKVCSIHYTYTLESEDEKGYIILPVFLYVFRLPLPIKV